MLSGNARDGVPDLQVIEADLADPAYAAATVRLLNEYALDPMGRGSALSRYARENLVPELLKRPAAHAILALVGDVPAGLLICMEGFSTFACRPLLNIHDVIVTRAYRGRGLARRLLEKAEALARALGCCKMTLEVLEGNRVARAAYRSFGFAGYELDPRAGKAEFWQKWVEQPEPHGPR